MRGSGRSESFERMVGDSENGGRSDHCLRREGCLEAPFGGDVNASDTGSPVRLVG